MQNKDLFLARDTMTFYSSPHLWKGQGMAKDVPFPGQQMKYLW